MRSPPLYIFFGQRGEIGEARQDSADCHPRAGYNRLALADCRIASYTAMVFHHLTSLTMLTPSSKLSEARRPAPVHEYCRACPLREARSQAEQAAHRLHQYEAGG